MSWDDLNLTNLKKLTTTYDLDDLFCHVSYRPTASRRRRIETSQNVGDSCDAIAWIQSLIPDRNMFTFTADITVSAFKQYLIPFLFSIDNRPDGVVLKKFNTVTLPLFILEVHSSPYQNSVSQTAADLQQFRLLRCFNHNYNKCVLPM